MGLPTIPDYPMPPPDRYPPSRVGWRCDPRRAVLLVHDMQQYFVDAFAPGHGPLGAAISGIRALRQVAHQTGIPVLYTAQPPDQSPDQRGLLADFWGPGIGGDGRDRIIADLAPGPGDALVTKWRYNAFVRTELRQRLDDLGRDQLIVTGIYAHIGCLITTVDAFMRDIQPFFVADAMADFDLEFHQLAITYAALRCARVVDAGALIGELDAPMRPAAGAEPRLRSSPKAATRATAPEHRHEPRDPAHRADRRDG